VLVVYTTIRLMCLGKLPKASDPRCFLTTTCTIAYLLLAQPETVDMTSSLRHYFRSIRESNFFGCKNVATQVRSLQVCYQPARSVRMICDMLGSVTSIVD
jgi:hypothetical protein